jgi:pyruvate-ferredoxin/flavodoxin oxidoreductase
MRITVDKHAAIARDLLEKLRSELGDDLVDGILHAPQQLESEIFHQRERIGLLKVKLLQITNPDAYNLLSVADTLVRRSVWLVGGDGWAYDIGSGGLDHVLASGKNVNVLVLDTEVYSNTGGQMSKATPTAATAKFAAAGKRVGKKDLAMQAISYGNVYVAQIAMGANPQQTLLAMREAEAYPGPSLVLAYSHCIAHGIDMAKGMNQQKLAAASGHWPLIRYSPALRQAGKNPFILDSPRPTISLKDYAYNELRYRILSQTKPDDAEHLLKLAQEIINLRWETYEDMASWQPQDFQPIA